MGGKSSNKAPKQPTPDQQAAANEKTAVVQADLNSYDIFTPSYSTTWNKTPDGKPLSQTTSLSPTAQTQFDLGNALSEELLRYGQDRLTHLPQGTLEIGQFTPQDYSTQLSELRDSIYKGSTEHLEDDFTRERDDFATRMAVQGLPVGSEAYNRALGEVTDRQGGIRRQAGYQADVAARDEAARRYGIDQNLFMTNAQLQESDRMRPIQEALTAITGAPSVPTIGQGAQGPQTGVQGTDLSGLYNAALQKYGIDQQAAGNSAATAWGTAGTVAGAALGGPFGAALGKWVFSDRHLKTGVRRVGTLPSGLPVYRFRYIWGGPERTGVMADDVEQVFPHAVSRNAYGFAMVDYSQVA